MGFMAKRIRDSDVQLGLAALWSFVGLGITSLEGVRKGSYKLFYYVHVTLSGAILVLLWFHVVHVRAYVAESAVVYALVAWKRRKELVRTVEAVTGGRAGEVK